MKLNVSSSRKPCISLSVGQNQAASFVLLEEKSKSFATSDASPKLDNNLTGRVS